MNIRLNPFHARPKTEQGISLIECLVYIAVLGVVLTVALFGFNRCWDDNKHLRRNADDIVRALHAGEQWRADIRTASGPIQVVAAGNAEQCIIPHPGYTIYYSFGEGTLQRQAGKQAPRKLLLAHVNSSHMQADARSQVTAWRWELELVNARKKVGLRPWFSFESVPPQFPHP